MNKSPCYKCVERISGCHSGCSKYIAWRSAHTAIREKIQEEKRKENDILSEPFIAVKRSRK